MVFDFPHYLKELGTVSSPDFLIMEHKRIDSQLDRAVVETLMKVQFSPSS